jgi:hypothetical protein
LKKLTRREAITLASAGTAAAAALVATRSLLAAATGAEKEAPAPDTPKPPAAEKPDPGDLKPIDLPKPQADGGKSVLAALWERKTNRNIKDEKLPVQTLSNLLWAAWGVNRPASTGRLGRTAASASNSQEIDLYVALPEGIYLYEAEPHRLTPVVAGDLRSKTARNGAAGKAPVGLIFVANVGHYANGRPQEPGLKDPEIQKSYYNVATGLIAGNVYLFAASQGLAAWFHNCDKPALTAALKLGADQHVLYAQTVGVPA